MVREADRRPVTRIGQTLVSTEHDWRSCTLDGLVERVRAMLEAKHTNAFASPKRCSSATCPSCSTTWR